MAASTDNVILDLTSRFLTNLPDGELESFERLFFQLEQAFWFYNDHYKNQKKYNLRSFCCWFFQNSPFLRPYLGEFDGLFAQFRDYMGQVPVNGLILINEELSHCLLVRGYKGKTWGFPKGKVNSNETDSACAIREVYEEVGFDAKEFLQEDEVLSYQLSSGKKVKLFLVNGVDDTYPFEPKSDYEIDEIKWFAIDKLPKGHGREIANSKFWMVQPFMKGILSYVSRVREKQVGEEKRSRAAPDSRPYQSHNKSRTGHSKEKDRKRSGKDREQLQRDALTFGEEGLSKGWSSNEMFKTNETLFGVKPTVVADEEEKLSAAALPVAVSMNNQRIFTGQEFFTAIAAAEKKLAPSSNPVSVTAIGAHHQKASRRKRGKGKQTVAATS